MIKKKTAKVKKFEADIRSYINGMQKAQSRKPDFLGIRSDVAKAMGLKAGDFYLNIPIRIDPNG